LPELAAAVFGTAFVGFALSGFATCVGFGTALRRRVRVWVSPGLRAARRARVWPPAPVLAGTSNRAGPVLLTALRLFLLSCYTVGVFVVGELLLPARPAEGVVVAFSLASLVVGVVLLLCLKDWLHRRALAERPTDCWPEEEWRAYAKVVQDAAE